MTQESIAISTTPPLPGLKLVQDVNKALQTIASDFAGPTDPASLAGPFMTWADSANLLLKRRNAANSAWVTLGPLLDYVYGRSNIVGTVSQSAGVPTGAIVESEDDGVDWYIRWADGTQICGIRSETAYFSISSAYGALYAGNYDWTFAKAFIAKPTVPAPTMKWGSGASWCSVDSRTKTVASLVPIDVQSRSASTGLLMATAFGRWY